MQRLFRINLNDNSSTILRSFNSVPVGNYYEEINNRLIVLTLVNGAPILGYDLANNILDTIRITNINDPDAICTDSSGNYYITSFSDNVVYRFTSDFSIGPEIISSGHGGPSGIGYNERDNILGITNYNFNSIDLIELDPNSVYYRVSTTPNNYALSQNFPNPFNPATTINYQIPERSFVTLKAYDVLGNEVATLINDEKPAGSYEVSFDASSLPSGVYFYKLHAGSFTETKKMILLR
ncbi:MAG: T9SS type A sorting domain-containing protein [Ignavibacteriaceae bacterium]|nr:T9SS type A sorting domain-containing protein [Ignavibacteriaceae bacterium]